MTTQQQIRLDGRYALFSGFNGDYHHTDDGGWVALRGTYDNVDEAEQAKDGSCEWWHIVDLTTRQLVKCYPWPEYAFLKNAPRTSVADDCEFVKGWDGWWPNPNG